MRTLIFALTTFCLWACQQNQPQEEQPAELLQNSLEQVQYEFKNYDALATAEVMVLGTFHFSETALESQNQESIHDLTTTLAKYNPSKIVLEWEPARLQKLNEDYQAFLKDSFDISQRPNEVFQLGFRLAKAVNHDSLYLFDDQTEFIGSLEDFSFDAFSDYAEKNDEGFYNKHEGILTSNFNYNEELTKAYDFADHITLLNSPEAQRINAQRMHMYEVRVGIQENWIGPDWLGRWYRRNVRMMSNVLQMAEPGDRILIIVGSNHKWTLDMLFESTPDFKLASSWDFLTKN